jgi:Rrf2 family protein
MGRGVEWVLHCCLDLAWVARDGRAVPSVSLAAYHGLPAAYLSKQFQLLCRAGLVTSMPGRQGGLRLALSSDRISLLDVVVAIEGKEPAFRCMEIRRQGPGGVPGSPDRPCSITQAMRRAELAWRRELQEISLADIAAEVEFKSPSAPAHARQWFATN